MKRPVATHLLQIIMHKCFFYSFILFICLLIIHLFAYHKYGARTTLVALADNTIKYEDSFDTNKQEKLLREKKKQRRLTH